MGACCQQQQQQHVQAQQIEIAVATQSVSPSTSPIPPPTVESQEIKLPEATQVEPTNVTSEKLKSDPTEPATKEAPNDEQAAVAEHHTDDDDDEDESDDDEQQQQQPEHDSLQNAHEKPAKHWREQTMLILSELSGAVNLGDEFEHSESDEHDEKTTSPQHDPASALQVDDAEPRALVNIPRKSYISYAQDIDREHTETPFTIDIGQTLQCADTANENACVWRKCDASRFKLRTIQYTKNKRSKLQASQPALFEVIGVDCFRINDKKVATMSDLNELLRVFNLAKYTNNSLSSEYPSLLVLNLMIPLFTKNERDGLQILIYAQMSEAFRTGTITKETACVHLLENLLNKQELAMNSFKMTLSMPNVDETTLKALTRKLVKTLNGKCMALKQHAVYGYMEKEPDKDRNEDAHDDDDDNKTNQAAEEDKRVFVVNFNGFGLNKQMIKGLSTIREHLATIDFEIGFHIGSKVKQGLPERMLLCVKLNKLDLRQFVDFREFYTRRREEFEREEERKKHARVVTYVMDDTAD